MFAAGTVVFALLVGLRRPIMRAIEAVLLIAAIPLLAAVPPLAALVIAVTLTGVVAIIESRLHRRADAAHGGHEPESAESAP
jgi:hypothetical protein